ncbi:hypothetical protein SSOG_00029 [Streptomyces himastatinicus ATCC 53653]|uniref:MftR C-terminal domain-containing protein n=2 Tax=Streptomyces violaceusniger group TaxID=2839105 RepID=D9W5W1_9ACTN|nr:hypothetical protein SSOG_00029 [Streptomyces himastatinicus ATCC 53653]
MRLILQVPALQAHSILRYADWRAVAAKIAAQRLNQPVDALLAAGHRPRLARCGGGVLRAVAARRDADLDEPISQAMRGLAEGFQGHEPPSVRA